MIHIFRGDSANETFGNQITVALETDMDTTDCKARLSMPYMEDKTSFIVNGRAVFTFTTEETAQIPFGEYYASLSLLNGSAKLTIRDDLIVSVTDSVAEASRDNTISVDVVGRFTEALKGVVWDEGSTIKTLREFLSRVGEAMGATVVRLALVSMLPLFAFSQGTIDADLLRPNIQVVTNAFQNASNDIARLIESTITPSDRITDGSHTLYPSLDYEETYNVPDTWDVDGEILYPSSEGVSWTNGTMSLLYESGTQNWYMYVGGDSSAGMDYPRSATNMDFSVGGVVYQARLVPSHTETRTVGRVALTNEVPSNASVNERLEKTNPVGFGGIDWSADGLSIRGDVDVNADQVHINAGMISLEGLSDGFTFNDSRVVTEATMPSILTTNDVCNIVTNEVAEYTTNDVWECNNPIGKDWLPEWNGEEWFMPIIEISLSADTISYTIKDEDSPEPGFEDFVYTRIPASTRNALGLARLIDLPPLTNGLISATYIATNNPAFVAAVTNCPVVIAAADGTTLGEFGDYGSLGALLAALAAAITWLKANKADASSLPYALVDMTPTAGAPFVLAARFPIVFDDSDVFDTHTITQSQISDITVTRSASDGKYVLSFSGFGVVCTLNQDGTFSSAGPDVEGPSLTFNEFSPNVGETQVLGFTPTYALTDRAINSVSLTESATLAFPAQTAGKARDFVVRLTLTETNDVVPSVTFPADVAYETEGGEWPDLTEAGTYIVRLTEVPKASESETARFFLQCSSAVADATPPSAGGAS